MNMGLLENQNTILKIPRKNQAKNTTIYFCRRCRRAWHIVDRHLVKYPPWIKGDEFKTCPECEKKEEA